ncbi:MAG: BlaI/MecI/CopY family transcriptional regulator [Xanthomonadaceae bacterium]|jgi:predicted transcriptional regulator|nr:BlaI/MecI/CopY family transcriptional regulator [Xanthomonadaceae bacterium]
MPISDAESRIMELLWQESPRSAEDLAAILLKTQDWQPGTVKALLNRMLRKRAIAATRDGRRFLYRPLLAREAYLTEASTALLDRLFDGRLAPLVAHFARHRRLGRRDLAELKRLIKEMDDDDA